MATGISSLNEKSAEDFFLKFQEEHDIQKDRERKLKATQFRKRMRNHCKGLNNCENNSDDDIIIIDDLLSNERAVRPRKNSNKNANDDQKTEDEILARKLQEEYDHEYATSLDNNFVNNLDRTNNDDGKNSNVAIPETAEHDTGININDQIFSFGQNSAHREAGNNNSDLINELNFLHNNDFMLQFLNGGNQHHRPRITPNYNRRNRRQVQSLLNRTRNQNISNSVIQSDRDFTADDYEALLMLDEKINVKTFLTKQEMGSLPSYPYKENDQDQEENKCSICFELYKRGEKLTSLACLHKFHTGCIKNWLLKESRKCPLCQNDAINGNA